MMRGGELWPLMLFDPHTVLGSSRLAPSFLPCPSKELGPGTSWELGPQFSAAPTKTFHSL